MFLWQGAALHGEDVATRLQTTGCSGAVLIVGLKVTGRWRLDINQDEKHETKPAGRRPLWPWLLLGLFTLLAIHLYMEVNTMMDDLARTWSDLVQLFWWIMPDPQD